MSLRRRSRTVREDDSGDEKVALNPDAATINSKPPKITFPSDEEDNCDEDGDNEQHRESTQHGRGGGDPEWLFLSPEASHDTAVSHRAVKAAEASARAIRGKASKTRSSGRGGLGEEGGDGAKDAGVMIDLALDDSVTSPAPSKSDLDTSPDAKWEEQWKEPDGDGGREEGASKQGRGDDDEDDGEDYRDEGSEPSSPLLTGRRRHDHPSRGKDKGKGRASGGGKSNAANQGPCRLSRPGGETPASRRVISSSSEEDSGDESLPPPPDGASETRTPLLGPSSRLRSSNGWVGSGAEPGVGSARGRSGRPRRAAATAVNYAAMNEGLPVDEESSEDDGDSGSARAGRGRVGGFDPDEDCVKGREGAEKIAAKAEGGGEADQHNERKRLTRLCTRKPKRGEVGGREGWAQGGTAEGGGSAGEEANEEEYLLSEEDGGAHQRKRKRRRAAKANSRARKAYRGGDDGDDEWVEDSEGGGDQEESGSESAESDEEEGFPRWGGGASRRDRSTRPTRSGRSRSKNKSGDNEQEIEEFDDAEGHEDEDGDEGEDEEEGGDYDEGEGESSHAALFHQQMLEDEQDSDDPTLRAIISPAHTEDPHDAFLWYMEFLAMAVQGGGKGAAFMEEFGANRHKFGAYRVAAKKFEDRICTVRESIAGGGSWNQEFKSALTKYCFVGFGFTDWSELDDEDRADPEPCAACHRKEFANISRMYLAGNGYDAGGVWMRTRWDKLLPKGWDDQAVTEASRKRVHECLHLGKTCRDKSHLYHSLLHYKVYLVCKIRRKMDFEGITPHMLRHDRFREFGENEMAAVDELVKRAERMAKMKDWNANSEDGLKMIRRWQYVPLHVVEQEEAKRDYRIKLDRSSAEKEEDEAPSKGRRGSRAGGGRSGRYGDSVTSESDDPDDMTDFIVEG